MLLLQHCCGTLALQLSHTRVLQAIRPDKAVRRVRGRDQIAAPTWQQLMQTRVWLMCVLGASLVGGWAIWRYSRPSASLAQYEAEADRLRSNAQAYFMSLPTTRFDHATDADGLANDLVNCTIETQGRSESRSGEVRGVARAVADLLFHRYRSDRPSDYIAWREAAGYQWKNRDELLRLAGGNAAFALATGRNPAPDEPIASVFSTIWADVKARTHDTSLPVSFSADDAGRLCVIGSVRQGGPRLTYPRPTAPERLQLWMAPPAARYVSWFAPPERVETWLSIHKQLDAATYAIVIACKNDTRHAFLFRLVKEPGTDRWFVVDVDMYGALEPNMLGLF